MPSNFFFLKSCILATDFLPFLFVSPSFLKALYSVSTVLLLVFLKNMISSPKLASLISDKKSSYSNCCSIITNELFFSGYFQEFSFSFSFLQFDYGMFGHVLL